MTNELFTKNMYALFAHIDWNDLVKLMDEQDIRHDYQPTKDYSEIYDNLLKIFFNFDLIKRAGEIYNERKRLNNLPYKVYLETDYWYERARHHKFLFPKCALCSSTENLNVHHNTYDHKGYEYEQDLVTLCEKCHKLFHGITNEENEDGK